jgi:hypothetical protein
MNPHDNSTQSGRVPLFLREMSRKLFLGQWRAAERDVAGRPKATGNVPRIADSNGWLLEDASEEAAAVAQQTAEDSTEEAATDAGAAEAALATDVVVDQVRDGADSLKPAANKLAVLRVEALDDVADLVVAGEDSALVSEDAAFTVQQTAHKPVQHPSVDPTEEAAETARTGRSRNRAYRSKAQTEYKPGCTDPSY